MLIFCLNDWGPGLPAPLATPLPILYNSTV